MPSFNRKRVENNFMSGDLEQSAYTSDSGNAVENTAVDTAAAGGVSNVMPCVWQVPVAIPVALPVAIPVKELVSRVSLRLILLRRIVSAGLSDPAAHRHDVYPAT
jgi:hypothetical protein